MIEPVSLLYLASAVGMGILAVLAAVMPRPRTRTTVYFALFCTSVALWSAGAAIALNILHIPDPMLGELFSGAHVLTIFMALGVAVTPTFWLLFAFERSGLSRWTHGWRGWLVGAHSAFSFIAIVTNPIHHSCLYLTPDGMIAVGALGMLNLVWAWALGLAGMVILVRHEWHRGTPAGRHRAGTMLTAAAVVIGGSIIWTATGTIGSGAESFTPAPALFLVLALLLSHDVLRYGFADLVTPAADTIFEAVSEGLILTDTELRIIALNPAAQKILPHAKESMLLEEVSRELTKHASFCMQYACDDLAFEAKIDESVYWGRVRRTAEQPDETTGVLLVLTDLTDLRDAHRRLLSIGTTAEGETSTEEYTSRLSGDR